MITADQNVQAKKAEGEMLLALMALFCDIKNVFISFKEQKSSSAADW